MRARIWGIGVALGILMGCTATSDTEGLTRDDLAAGAKADATLAERYCVQMGQPAFCDPCEVGGFYGDGTCDLFCSRADDDDCGSYRSEESCAAMDEQFLACSENARHVEDCLPEGRRLEMEGCCGSWDESYCALIAPVTRDDLPQVVMSSSRVNEIASVPAGMSGQHRYFAHDVAAFDAAAMASALRALDAERGCADRRRSQSREDGVALYQAFLDEAQPYGDFRFRQHPDQFLDHVAHPDNLGFFASVPSDDSPECQYHEFILVSPSGRGSHLFFDEREGAPLLSLGSELARYVDPAGADLASRHDYWAGNGSGSGLAMIVGEFSEDQYRRYVASHFLDFNDNCYLNRISTNTEEALEIMEMGIAEELEWVDSDEAEMMQADMSALRDYANDEDTIAVFATGYDRSLHDNSESCLIFQTYVVRRDGTVLDVEWNHTD